MGYSLHIQKPDETAITFDEWADAVAKTNGCRFYEDDFVGGVNPKTGEEIRIRSRKGDVEVFLPDEDEWVVAINWSDSGASFSGSAVDRLPDGSGFGPVWEVAVSLASHTRSQIVGDEGEVFTLMSNPID